MSELKPGIGIQVLRWLPAAAMMVLIFLFSHQPGSDSGNLTKLLLGMLGDIGIDLPLVFGKYASFFIRKLAHFTEYFILFFLLRLALKGVSNREKWALLLAFLYACSDEFHQLFIPGRVGNIGDVCVDTAGAAMAWLLVWLRMRRKSRS